MTSLFSPSAPFEWTPRCQRAFDYLKERLCTEPILTRFRPELPCILDCDFQGKTLGVVLSQHHEGERTERVIAYGSRCLIKTELRYTATRANFSLCFMGCRTFGFI